MIGPTSRVTTTTTSLSRRRQRASSPESCFVPKQHEGRGVAQGTHPPMTDAQKLAKIGDEHFAGRIFDHQWNNADEIVTLGELSVETVRSITGGLIDHAVQVTINRLRGAGVYDTVLVFGATVPHEIAGFAGGAKYFFLAWPDRS